MTIRGSMANMVFVIHLLIFLMALVIPFSDDKRLLSMYSILMVFVLFHWVINDDSCILTLIEKKLRNVEIEKTFFQQILGPIYNYGNNSDVIGKMLFFMLWLIVQIKLTWRYLVN